MLAVHNKVLVFGHLHLQPLQVYDGSERNSTVHASNGLYAAADTPSVAMDSASHTYGVLVVLSKHKFDNVEASSFRKVDAVGTYFIQSDRSECLLAGHTIHLAIYSRRLQQVLNGCDRGRSRERV